MSYQVSKYIIPENTKLIKIGSVNVNLTDSINRNENIKCIVDYIFSEVSDLILDIICLQGINDHNLANILIKRIYDESIIRKKPVHIVPKSSSDSATSFENSFQNQWNSDTNLESDEIDNIIISRYPIVMTSNVYLNNKNEEKLVKNKKIVVANIDVDGYLLSVYSTSLSDDYLNISNSEFRKKEASGIYKMIKTNTKEILKYCEKNNYKIIIKDVHILCANLNISEMKGDILNNELTHTLKSLNALDIFRCHNIINNTIDPGYTNVHNKRECYILISFKKDMHGEEYITPKTLMTKTYNELGVGVVMSYVVTSIKMNDNYPIECVFLLDKKEKKIITE